MPAHGVQDRRGTTALRVSEVVARVGLGLAVLLVGRYGVAQVPGASREELVQKWDLDRNGKVDANEVEIARAKMRKLRSEAAMSSGIDPLTGRPRQAIDPATGRPMPVADPRGQVDPGFGATAGSGGGGDDGGLILVPGTGERPFAAAEGPATLLPKKTPALSGTEDRVALPGTRAPLPPSTLPPVTVPSGAARGPTAARASEADPRRRGAEPAARPGVIAGGIRAGGVSGRPAPGQSPPADLNAGRLPAGLPQVRGGAGVAAGPTGTRGMQPGVPMAPNDPRLARPGNQTRAGVGLDPRQPAGAARGVAGQAAPTTPDAGAGRRWPPGAGSGAGASGQPPARAGVPSAQTPPRPPTPVPRIPRAPVGDVYAR